MKRIAVIGAGAAGCFCAAELRRLRPDFRVDVYESGPKALAKVAVTGGGRCNLTNSFEGIRSLAEAYPRGERLMKRLLKQFSQEDTWRWFESAGVPLVLQEDHCVFPQSQDAMDIVHALLRRMEGANLLLRTPVHRIETPDQVGGDGNVMPGPTGHLLVDGEPYDAVVVTTGGAPKGLPMLDGLDLEWVPTVPSLFTFTIRDEGLRSLMGLVVDASVAIPGTAFRADGPLLITDWGLSGPAVLKLSSYAGTETTNVVRELIGLDHSLDGRHVVVVEDIVDTGHTMRYTLQKLRDLKAADVRIATLFFKPANFQYDYPINYKGMDIGNEFIVGYGLDYDQQGRNLPDIYKVI